jgi:4-hydroxy-tetrahydrodipicolinate synthase
MNYFTGTYTALITPFTRSGEVDWAGLDRLVEGQIAAGIDGLVPVGTTGESPTLNTKEHMQVIEAVIKKAAGRCKIIAGTGANSTAEAIELTQEAKLLGIDGTLQVTPYYNKPNQTGLIRHFEAVADIGVPVVLYNVPGRSAKEIAISTIAELAQHPNIVSVKEAAGSVDRVSAIKNVCDIEVLSGDDALALPMISVGACGVISVASNVIPAQVCELINKALKGDFAGALKLHQKYYQLFCDMFIDTNPIPVKAAMSMKGLCEESYRLPLCALSDADKNTLRISMQNTGVL